jgi:hypothetical protein
LLTASYLGDIRLKRRFDKLRAILMFAG